MISTRDVVSGRYIDYGRGFWTKRQWLMGTKASAVWTNFLGILFTIAVARLLKIALRIKRLAERHENSLQAPVQPAFDDPGAANIHAPTEFHDATPRSFESYGWDHTLLAWRQLRPGDHRPIRWRQFSIHAGKGLIFGTLFFGVIIIGVSVAYFASSNTGLSNSPNCGFYLPQALSSGPLSMSKMRNATIPINRKLAYEAEVQSAEQARNCFHAPDGTDGCNYFLYNSIDYTVEETAACPFQSDMCYGNSSNALRLATDAVDARRLGINAPKTYEFRRDTTCSPINMNETFIKVVNENGKVTIKHLYGPTPAFWGSGEDTTFKFHKDTDFGDTPAYLTIAFSTGPGGWMPIPAMRVAPFAVGTLIFILPRKIWYPARREDPIFPATHEWKWANHTWWMYDGGHARVLGCVDHRWWRDPQKDNNWHEIFYDFPAVDQEHSQTRGGFSLLWYALFSSDIWQSMYLRQGQALNATQMLVGYDSLPLPKEQWKVEVIQLFETSLARMLLATRNVARGFAKDWGPGVVKENYSAEACYHTYIFYTQGWTDVNMLLSLLVLIPSLLILLLSIPVEPRDESDDLRKEDMTLVFEMALLCCSAEAFSYYVVKMLSYLWKSVRKVGGFVKYGFQAATRWLGEILSSITHRPIALD